MANVVFLLHSQQGLVATSSKMFLRKHLSKAGFLCSDNFKVILHELGRPGAAILVDKPDDIENFELGYPGYQLTGLAWLLCNLKVYYVVFN